MAYTNGMNAVSEYAQFYNSDNHDRVYDADSMAEWLTPFFVDGVFNGQMQVTANNNMTVSVAPGFGYIDGKVKHFPSSTILNIDIAHAQYERIDLIVLRRDDTLRDFFLDVIKGEPAKDPVPPALTRNNTIWELQLAAITIPEGATAITQSAISDTRMDSSVCGWVAATVEEIDFDQIKAQFDTWFDEYQAFVVSENDGFVATMMQFQQDFLDWFQHMKDQLSTDAAGNLQLQIDDLTRKVEDDVETAITELHAYSDQRDLQLLQSLDSLSIIAMQNSMWDTFNADLLLALRFDDDFAEFTSGIFLDNAYVSADDSERQYMKGFFLNSNISVQADNAFNIQRGAVVTAGTVIEMIYTDTGLYEAEPRAYYNKNLAIGSSKYVDNDVKANSSTVLNGVQVYKKNGAIWEEITPPISDSSPSGKYKIKLTVPENIETTRVIKYGGVWTSFNGRVTRLDVGFYGKRVASQSSPSYYLVGFNVFPVVNVKTKPYVRGKIAKKAVVSLDIASSGWIAEIQISNNANDPSPVWEDCSQGELISFRNEIAENNPAIALKIKMIKQYVNDESFSKIKQLSRGAVIALWE